jgi:hypothetical protein
MKTTTFLTLAALTLAFARAAADPPSPTHSTIPCGFNLVGLTSPLRADPIGEFEIVIRGFVGQPLPGVLVEIVMDDCAPDLRLCEHQPGTPATTPVEVSCVPPRSSVRASTDDEGRVRLALVGSASNTHAGAPAAGWQCARVYADGILMASVNVGAYDQNGAGGGNPADASIWSEDNWDEDYESRSDLDCSHSVNPADLSLMLNSFDSLLSCTNHCQ